MKKLMITIAVMASMISSYAITAEEAIASKNYYTIEEYCKTNKLNMMSFLFKSNRLERIEYVEIYNSITNNLGMSLSFPRFYINTFRKDKFTDVETYNFAKDNLYSLDKFNQNQAYVILSKNIKNKRQFSKEYSAFGFTINEIFPDFMNIGTNKSNKVDICLKFYSISKDKKYLDMVNYNDLMNNGLYSLALDYAIVTSDVDKMIDVLLVVQDVDAKQANAIIEPINSVESSYRKQDILKGLENINSRCTIKLYDDQKTWEPILAKIRAMISLRK